MYIKHRLKIYENINWLLLTKMLVVFKHMLQINPKIACKRGFVFLPNRDSLSYLGNQKTHLVQLVELAYPLTHGQSLHHGYGNGRG
jgi:hypothetical protein